MPKKRYPWWNFATTGTDTTGLSHSNPSVFMNFHSCRQVEWVRNTAVQKIWQKLRALTQKCWPSSRGNEHVVVGAPLEMLRRHAKIWGGWNVVDFPSSTGIHNFMLALNSTIVYWTRIWYLNTRAVFKQNLQWTLIQFVWIFIAIYWTYLQSYPGELAISWFFEKGIANGSVKPPRKTILPKSTLSPGQSKHDLSYDDHDHILPLYWTTAQFWTNYSISIQWVINSGPKTI